MYWRHKLIDFLIVVLLSRFVQSSNSSPRQDKRYSSAFLSHQSAKSLLHRTSPENFFPTSPRSLKSSSVNDKARKGQVKSWYSTEMHDLTAVLLDIESQLQGTMETSMEPNILEKIISTLHFMSLTSLTTLVDEVSKSSTNSPFPVQDIEGGSVSAEQLVVGFVAGVFPFVWAAYEFWKRIDTQQRCGVCKGSGLVSKTEQGKVLKVARKCYACGGFIPWLGWKYFWLSNLNIGNGGILQRPADNYEELSASAKKKNDENS